MEFLLIHLNYNALFSVVLPSYLSNFSAIEIHLDVGPNILLLPTDTNIVLPLHARYQPLNESGYSTIEFGAPDISMQCSTKEKVENHNCFFKLINDDANMYVFTEKFVKRQISIPVITMERKSLLVKDSIFW